MLTYLVRLFAGCQHDSTYRERRLLHGAQVMHFVCNDCGHTVPAVDRTEQEHLMVLQAGAIRVPLARPRTNVVLARGLRRSA
jgi:hypothetical protein